MPISGNNLKTYLDSNLDQNWPDPAITRKFRLWFLVFQASASLLRVLGAVFQCRNSGRSLFWSEPLLLRHIDSFTILRARRQTRILFRIFILQVIYFQMTSFSLKSGLLDSNVRPELTWPNFNSKIHALVLSFSSFGIPFESSRCCFSV